MMGTTNPQLKGLITELKKLSSEKKVPLWKRIAKDLEKPTRERRIVNISKLNRFTKENETVVVPGKVLGSGLLDHKLTVAAWDFSQSALEQIKKVNAKAMSIQELAKEDIKGKRIRIIG